MFERSKKVFILFLFVYNALLIKQNCIKIN